MTKSAECLIDTNAILRYLLNDIPEQSALAKEVFDALRANERTALLLESVLAECVYILFHFYKVPKKELAEKLDSVLRYPGIVNQDKPGLREALKLFAVHNVDFVDCVLIAKARIGELELITFDKSLKALNLSIRLS